MEIGQKSAIKYRCFDFIGKLYEDFKNLTNFNRTFSLACAIAAGYLILRGSGMFPEPSISLILLTAIFIILLSSSRKSFYFILFPLVCLHAIYTPTGLNFGAPSYQYIASVLATDMLETKEFLMQIPVSSYLAALAIPLLVFYITKVRSNLA